MPVFVRASWRLLMLGLLLATLSLVSWSGIAPTEAEVAAAPPPRTVIVHLFEWRWPDVALECENFLGPKGYAAVQVSPPNEHALISGYPWWQRYQPVSYTIHSRSGTRAEFADMVRRCRAAGVDIYVDAVINHMTAVVPPGESRTGIAGSQYSHYDYPGTYTSWDFHYCGTRDEYGRVTHDIYSYQERWQVQDCELVNLADLNTGSSYVRDRIAAYLNDLVSLGVAGFRLDASKHIPSDDIKAILSRVNGSPYIFQEVIDQGGEPITASEYFQNGDVTEFKYSVDLSRVFYEGRLAWFNGSHQFGEGWGYMASEHAVVFVNNHDNQRGHGGGGHIITYKDGKLYDLAQIFMLAWPYGYPKVMSSYHFDHPDQGPPSNGNGNTNRIWVNGSPDCFDEWKCEHRWRPVANMVAFRNHTSSNFYVSNWWSNGNNQIAFGRGNQGFVVINREGSSLGRTFQTSMPAGTYCDVIKGELNGSGNGCTGRTITVDGAGRAYISVGSMDAAAIHVGARVN